MTVFGVPWSELEVEDVERFLADAGDEPLLWEAKGGGERPHPGSVRKAACGFANSRGGFLIVGADREADAWTLAGVDFRGQEPQLWLGQQVRDGLRPTPRFDVRSWERVGGREVAVVQIEPVAVPPCMTADGTVYERVSGATVPVTDPAVLARLYERGRAAELHAENAAIRRAKELVVDTDPGNPPFLHIGIVVAPTGRPEDLGATLFTESFERRGREIVLGLPPEPLLLGGAARGVQSYVRQDLVGIETPALIDVRHRWTARASWDGAVGVMLAVVPDRDEEGFTEDALFNDALRPAVAAVVELVAATGGFGRAHVVFATLSRGCSFWPADGSGKRQLSSGNGLGPIRDWTEQDGRLSEEAFGRIQRQFLRGLGIKAWEPDGDARRARGPDAETRPPIATSPG